MMTAVAIEDRCESVESPAVPLLEVRSLVKQFPGTLALDRVDLDGDGKHSKEEYIDKGGYMTPQARAGIFRAADGNGDGIVTKTEYVLNRIITDEAKSIVQGMDDDKDRLVERAEFVVHGQYLATDEGLPEATGQRYVLPAGAFFAFENDLISRVTVYYNLGDWESQVIG